MCVAAEVTTTEKQVVILALPATLVQSQRR
jgi:hypothetical protein